MTTTVLDKIKAYKLEEVAADKQATPLAEIEAQAREADPVRGFAGSGAEVPIWDPHRSAHGPNRGLHSVNCPCCS